MDIEFYKDALNFILLQDNKTQVRLFTLIKILEEYDGKLGAPYVQEIDAGIFILQRKPKTLFFIRREEKIIFILGINCYGKISENIIWEIKEILYNRGQMISEFRELLNKRLQDPEFKKEWDALQPEMDAIKVSVDSANNIINSISQIRKDKELAQKQLSEISGIKQPVISRIENGTNDPQLSTILRLLGALGYTLELTDIKGR